MPDQDHASILSIKPNGAVTVVWDGVPRQDLVTFDEAGFKFAFQAFCGHGVPPSDTIILNIMKSALNSYVRDYDFNVRGPIHFNGAKAEALFGAR